MTVLGVSFRAHLSINAHQYLMKLQHIKQSICWTPLPTLWGKNGAARHRHCAMVRASLAAAAAAAAAVQARWGIV